MTGLDPVASAIGMAGIVLTLALTAAVLDGVIEAMIDAASGGRPTGGLTGTTGPARRGAVRPLVETARLLRQRRRTTVAADTLLWRLGVSGPLTVALLMAAVVPLGDLVVGESSVGIVWFNAMDVLLWAAVWLAGWGANSALALVGGYRYLAQALGYELPLMFALTAPAVAAASLDVTDVVAAQADRWNVVWMPVAFLVFVGCVAAYSMWGPFAYPLARDVAGGVLAEVSGVDRLLLLAGRYALLVVGSAMAVALFLGGGSGPWLPGWLWALVKTLGVVVGLLAVRRAVPVLRADVLVAWAWLVVLPLTLGQLLVVSVITYLGAG